MKKRLFALFVTFFALISVLVSDARAAAHEYETFDGRVYNGKYYPRVDIIEWSEDKEPSHMEFQNYGFIAHPIDMTFELDTKTGKPVMLVHYFLKNRNEHLCRRVIAPGHFKEGQQIFVYKKIEADREITYVAAQPLAEMAGRTLVAKPSLFAACVDNTVERSVASDEKTEDGDQDAKRTKNAHAKDSKSVPFGDW